MYSVITLSFDDIIPTCILLRILPNQLRIFFKSFKEDKPWFHVKINYVKAFHTRAAAIGRPSYFLFQAWFHHEMK